MDIKIQKDSKGEISSIILTGVKFYYTSIRRPGAIYDDRKLPFKDARKEYKVTVGVDEDIADQWDEIFSKQPSKKYPNNAKFKEAINIGDDDSLLPVPEAKKQWTIRVAQKELKTDGEKSIPPKVMEVVNGKGVDITLDKNVGNGSEGNIKVRVIKNDYGTFCYPDTIVITKLFEYEDRAGGLSEEEMEAMGITGVEERSQEEQDDPDLYSNSEPEAAPAKSKGKGKPAVEDEDF